MRTYDLILKKREGLELSLEEIRYLIEGYTAGDIPDYQMAALLMAIYFQGLTPRETADLTLSMVSSGKRLDLSAIPGVKVDKHSTGGVGDKTSLILVPLVAAAGVPVAKMSGRALGYTGGTIDKLEAIPGFRTAIAPADFIKQVKEVGAAVIAQTSHFSPADKKLYALRDLTATVDSIPLIASSIMSKKIAAGANKIVLDVKVGSGAFMKDLKSAFALANAMIEIGNLAGRHTVAVVTDMNQPLGYAVGNALEVKEAIDTLNGCGPQDLVELCLTLGELMLTLAGKASRPEEGRQVLKELIKNGSALEKFKEMVAAQGGKVGVVDNTELLPQAAFCEKVSTHENGFITKLDAASIGKAALVLGAGRSAKDALIDPGAGVVLHKKYGDYVATGEVLAELHGSSREQVTKAKAFIKEAFSFEPSRPLPRYLIYEVINLPQ